MEILFVMAGFILAGIGYRYCFATRNRALSYGMSATPSAIHFVVLPNEIVEMEALVNDRQMSRLRIKLMPAAAERCRDAIRLTDNVKTIILWIDLFFVAEFHRAFMIEGDTLEIAGLPARIGNQILAMVQKPRPPSPLTFPIGARDIDRMTITVTGEEGLAIEFGLKTVKSKDLTAFSIQSTTNKVDFAFEGSFLARSRLPPNINVGTLRFIKQEIGVAQRMAALVNSSQLHIVFSMIAGDILSIEATKGQGNAGNLVVQITDRKAEELDALSRAFDGKGVSLNLAGVPLGYGHLQSQQTVMKRIYLNGLSRSTIDQVRTNLDSAPKKR